MSRKEEVLHFIEAEQEELDAYEAKQVEAHRKGNVTLRVTDHAGNPVRDAHVHLTLKNHAFRHGANLFMLEELETPEKNERYKEKFTAAFNMATLPFYWDTLEPTEGKPRYAADSEKVYRRPAPDLCLAFCEAHGIEPREHALAYDHFFPAWLRGRSDAEVKEKLEARMAEIARRYADKIPTIEVTNEMNWWEGVSHFYQAEDYMPWCFRTAARYFPNNRLAINEFGTFDHNTGRWQQYYLVIEKLLRDGCRIDEIGMQFHNFIRREAEKDSARRFYDPRHILAVLDDYAMLNRPIEISEITIPAYSSSAEDEEIQARLIERLYRTWFSHPAVNHAIYWNLVDGYAYGAVQGDMSAGENYYHGGLLRFDLSPKPAYDVICDLFRHRYHTDERAVTDADGCVTLRGFFGDYAVHAEKNGTTTDGTLSLCQDGDCATLLL